MSSLNPSALLSILTQSAKLAGVESPAFELVAEEAKKFLDEEQKRKLGRALAEGRAARHQVHGEVQESLKGR